MNLKISGLVAGIGLVALTGCSSVYQSGQTPDDVYFSPGRSAVAAGGEEYMETNSRRKYNDRYYTNPDYRDDQYLRMSIAAGRRPYFYDDFAMMDPWMRNSWLYNSYMVWNSPFNSPWNSMYMWNSFYNPYYGMGSGWYAGGGWYGSGWNGGGWYGGGIPGKPGSNFFTAPKPSRPASAFTMSSYLNTNSGNRNGYTPRNYNGGNYNNSNRNYYNTNNNRRTLLGGDDNRSFNNSSNDRPARSYTPSSNSGGSSRSSSGSSGGGVSRPTRTGN